MTGGWWLPRIVGAAAVCWIVVELVIAIPGGLLLPLGHDYQVYVDATREWLSGGPWYEPYQLAGPYTVVEAEILYPPHALILFVPATVLPWVVWWGVPVAVVAWVIWSVRPSAWGWAAIFVCLAVPKSLHILTNGNPSMWVAAGVALGSRWGWPFAAALLKPTLAPLAIFGIRSRGFWVVAAGLVAVDVLLAGMTAEYVTVLLNARGPLVSPLYSLLDVPLMLLPLVARWTSQRQPARTLHRINEPGVIAATRAFLHAHDTWRRDDLSMDGAVKLDRTVNELRQALAEYDGRLLDQPVDADRAAGDVAAVDTKADGRRRGSVGDPSSADRGGHVSGR